MTRYAPLWEQANTYAASLDRRAIAALAGGAYPLVSGCAVTVAAGTMNMNIAAGSVIVPSQNNTGSTLCVSDAVETVTSPTAPASGTNRIDVVVCQARGNDLDGGTNNDWLFQVVAGTPAASPTVPATPAGAVAIAQITVIGGAASLAAGNLLDRRILQPWGAPWGVVDLVPVTTNTVNINTATDLTGLTSTKSYLANRNIRITSVLPQCMSGTSQCFWISTIMEGATQLARIQQTSPGVNFPVEVIVVAYVVPTAGTHTYKAQGQTGTALGQMICGVGQPAYFTVEDLGPAGAPVL
jgi:hypothetical protein